MKKKSFIISGALFVAFILWTVLVRLVDVRAVGPENSSVGFAGINTAFHKLTGVHMALYDITDLLAIVPVGAVLAEICVALYQWIKRKSLWKIDKDIFVVGGFDALVFAFFVLFEVVKINFRPILIEGVLETSYPSSTTLLFLSIMPVFALWLKDRIGNKNIKIAMFSAVGALTAFAVIGRLICGVHWLSDIVGGVLLSCALIMLYVAVVGMDRIRTEKEA